MHKERLDTLITENYQYLLQVSNNITTRQRNVDQKYNLLHEVILQLYDKIDRQNEFLKSKDDFRAYVTKYLKQFYTFQKNTKYTRKKDNNLFTYEPSFEDDNNQSKFYLEEKCDTKVEDIIYIEAENTNDITKLFLKDLILNDISIDVAMMVNKIKSVAKNVLTFEENLVFDLYYIQEFNCLEIYNELKRTNKKTMAYLKILKIQKRVKTKIKENLKW
jgi:hypothetical protein